MTFEATIMDPHPVHREDLRVHELDGEALLYDGKTADTHRMNGTAFFIWEKCDGRHTLEEITEAVTEMYEVSEVDAYTHVEKIVGEFFELRLVNKPGAASTR